MIFILTLSFTISLIISYYHHRLHHLHSIVAIFHAFPPHQIHPHRTPVLSSPPIPWIYKKTSTTVKYFRNNNDDPDFPFLLPWSWNRARRRYSKSIFHILFSNESRSRPSLYHWSHHPLLISCLLNVRTISTIHSLIVSPIIPLHHSSFDSASAKTFYFCSFNSLSISEIITKLIMRLNHEMFQQSRWIFYSRVFYLVFLCRWKIKSYFFYYCWVLLISYLPHRLFLYFY